MDTTVDQSSTIPTTNPMMIPIQAFRTPVRGHAFASPPPGDDGPVPGLRAELAREPDNPADPLAVAVWASPSSGARWRIGYLDRGVAARVAPRLDAGRRVRAQVDGWSTEPRGRWRRPLLLLLPDDEQAAIPSGTTDSGAETTPEPEVAAEREVGAEPQMGAEPGVGAEPEVGPEPEVSPEPAASVPMLVSGPTVIGRGGDGARTTPLASDDVPRLWGRPPGVRRRRVS